MNPYRFYVRSPSTLLGTSISQYCAERSAEQWTGSLKQDSWRLEKDQGMILCPVSVPIVSCSWLTGLELDVELLLCPIFNTLCILICFFSAHDGYKAWLFETSCQFKPEWTFFWPLSSTRHFLLLTGCFFFLYHSVWTLETVCVWKLYKYSFWNTHFSLSDINNHAMVKVPKITFPPILNWTEAFDLYLHDGMHCIASHDWLIR